MTDVFASSKGKRRKREGMTEKNDNGGIMTGWALGGVQQRTERGKEKKMKEKVEKEEKDEGKRRREKRSKSKKCSGRFE